MEYNKAQAIKEIKSSKLVFCYTSLTEDDGAYLQCSKGALLRVLSSYGESEVIKLQLRLTDTNEKHAYIN